MKARIGLDCRGLTNINRFRGIGHYTGHLVEELLRADSDYEFVLFGGEPADEGAGTDLPEGTTWRRLPRVPRASYLSLLAEHVALARAIRAERVDLFHAMDHNMTPFYDGRTLVTVHDLIPLILRGPYLGPTARLWQAAHRHAARQAEQVVTVSECSRDDVVRLWGIEPERIRVVYEGVEDSFQPADPAEIAQTLARHGIAEPYLLYLGGFDPRKNLSNMFLGFKRCAAARDCRLVLAGDYRGFESRIMEEIAEMGLAGRVTLTGFAEREDLPALYSGARGFLFLSLYEGFGLPVIEAMACGTPVVGANASCVPEIAGGAARLVDPLEPDEIAGAIAEVLEEDGKRVELIERGRRRAATFRWERTAAETLEIYERILEES